MRIPLYQVDAFNQAPFGGNPAAICPLEEWLDDALMQRIAAENNLAETAFFVAEDSGYRLRWFTPTTEVDLCGHATLASTFVLYEHLGTDSAEILFNTRSGELKAWRERDLIRMRFPAYPPEPCDAPEALSAGLGAKPVACYRGPNYLAVFETQAEIAVLAPNMAELERLGRHGAIVTAPAQDSEYDFVSRFFAPQFGIPEDPVTGAAHCMLTPYWAKRLDKKQLVGRQISRRGGTVHCQLEDDAVVLGGHAVLTVRGEIILPD